MIFDAGIENDITLTEAMEQGVKARVAIVAELDEAQLCQLLKASRSGIIKLSVVEE